MITCKRCGVELGYESTWEEHPYCAPCREEIRYGYARPGGIRMRRRDEG